MNLLLDGEIMNLLNQDFRMTSIGSGSASDPDYSTFHHSDKGSLSLPDSTGTCQSFQNIGSLNSIFALGAPPSDWKISEEDIANCQAYKLPEPQSEYSLFPMTFYVATKDFLAYALHEGWPNVGHILLLDQPICQGYNEMTNREFRYYDHFVSSLSIPVPESYQILIDIDRKTIMRHYRNRHKSIS